MNNQDEYDEWTEVRMTGKRRHTHPRIPETASDDDWFQGNYYCKHAHLHAYKESCHDDDDVETQLPITLPHIPISMSKLYFFSYS